MAFNAKLGAATTGNFKVRFEKPTQDVTLKNSAFSGSRLDQLGDVDTSRTSANGSILVYSQSSDTYIQREIFVFDAETQEYKFDGGNF